MSSYEPRATVNVYEIDVGATYWVKARSYAEAIGLLILNLRDNEELEGEDMSEAVAMLDIKMLGQKRLMELAFSNDGEPARTMWDQSQSLGQSLIVFATDER